jgi:molecular chaperone HscB
MDPFSTLGIARSYDVDLAALEKTHRELSRALHPDRYVGASASERRSALAKAVDVNEAWRVVRDPIRRAEALLTLSGLLVGEDREPKSDPEFLHRLAESSRARSDETERQLSVEFAGGSSGSLLPKLGELRYYRRFLDEVSAIEDELAA